MSRKKGLLKRYFSGESSRQEYRYVRELFFDSENSQELKNNLGGHWMDFKLDEEQENTNFDFLLNRIHHRLYLEENQRFKNLKKLDFLQRIAAIFILPFLLGFAGYYVSTKLIPEQVSYAEIQCPEGVRTKFVLPDGSSGFLNNGSKLKYTVPFKNQRVVSLEGEAFFDVTHDGTPFHVKTKSLDVEVMGTTFDVIAYENDQTEEVILATGKVNVSYLNGNSLAVLSPDQRIIFNNANKEYQVREVEAIQYALWRDGILIFRNEGLEDVAKKIGRWYNVDVEITNEQIKKYTFHATFMNQSLTDVLELLIYTSPISYKILKSKAEGNNELTEKQKIILDLDKTKVSRYE